MKAADGRAGRALVRALEVLELSSPCGSSCALAPKGTAPKYTAISATMASAR